jgi:hypothetical protein
VPLGIVIISALSSAPVTFMIRGQWSFLREHRDAAAAGGVLPPTFNGRWPGNIDVILGLAHSFRTGYPGNIVILVLEPPNYLLYVCRSRPG